MQKICLALNEEKLENYIREKVTNFGIQATFTSRDAIYRSMVLTILSGEKVDILIIRENLSGEMPFDELMSRVRSDYPDCRIIVMAGEHQPGDSFITQLINRGIYDFVYGENVRMAEVITMIRNPRSYKDVSHLQKIDSYGKDIESQNTVRYVDNLYSEKDKDILQQNESQFIKQQSISNNGQPSFRQAVTNKQPQVVQQINISQNVGSQNSGNQNIGYNKNYQQNYENNTTILSHENGLIDARVSAQRFNGIVFRPVNSSDFYGDSDRRSSDQTSVLTSNDAVGYNRQPRGLLPSSATVVAFTSARQGVGCTSTMFNLGYYLASQDKRVLLMDLVYGESSLFDKLGFRKDVGFPVDSLYGIDYQSRTAKSIVVTKQMLQSAGCETAVHIPQKLDFIHLSNTYKGECAEGIKNFIQGVSKDYDYILCDTNMGWCDAFIKSVFQVAHRICLVVTQDVYEINMANQCMNYYTDCSIYNKLVVVANKFVKGCVPDSQAFVKQFGTNKVAPITFNMVGHIKESVCGVPYVTFCKKKDKVDFENLYQFLR